MSRSIPPALATYMQGNSTQMCALIKVGPLPDGTYRYFSGLDIDVVYDDGDGEQTYRASTGMEVSAFVSSADLGVDNAEMDTLPPVVGNEMHGFTAEQIKSGELDAVPFVVYVVCYADTSLGDFIWSGGNLGEARIKGSALFNLEHRSITNKLKQNIVQQDSVHCRAIFGSQPVGTVGAEVTEKYPCGYDYSADWVSFTVETVHPVDTDLVFTTSGLAQASNYFRLGMVKMTTGANAGQQREVASNVLATGEQTFTLMYPFPHPLAEDDEGDARFGCDKLPSAATGCRRFFDEEWVNHYRGEPHQPSADANINLTGGAGVPGDVGGTGENPTGPTIPPVPPDPGGAGNPGSPTARSIGADTEDAVAHGASPAASAATNSTAVNAAFAALAGGGGTVFFSVPGTYQINTANPIELDRDNSRLDLDGVILQAAHSTTTTAPATHRDVVRVDGPDEWEIVNGEIRGYLDTWITGGGTSAYGVSEWAHGVFVTGGATNGTIKDITISKCVGDAISLGYSTSGTWIDNCELSDCRRQGISTGADNVTITNNNIHDIGQRSGTAPMAGIDVEVDSPESAANILIQGNTIQDTRGPNILCWLRTSNVDILDNELRRGTFGLLAHGSTGGTFQGNTVEYAKYHGAKFESNADTWTVGGVGNENTFGGNYTSINGTVTTGSLKTITGESSATEDHVYTSSDSSVTVGQNFYRP